MAGPHVLSDPDLAGARAGDSRAFERLLAPHRAALHRHCYRMLGDVHDADDALQETLTRAWRHLPGFEPRAPVRAWLYRIATNVCLTAGTAKARRTDTEAPMTAVQGPLDEALAHLGPYPGPSDPVEDQETLQLAFIAAGQMLPPRQRAILLLRDVLDFSAREVAAMLETSVQAVNSALQRARATLARERAAGALAHPNTPASATVERDLATRFARAWQAADVSALVRLLAEDALMTMPPQPRRVLGPAAVGSFLTSGPLSDPARRFAVRSTRVNAQPALALYRDDGAGGPCVPYSILALAIRGERIASITRFGADEGFFRRLGLPVRP